MIGHYYFVLVRAPAPRPEEAPTTYYGSGRGARSWDEIISNQERAKRIRRQNQEIISWTVSTTVSDILNG